MAAEVRALGRRARPVALDVTDAKSVRHLVPGCRALDVLVVSAGANVPKPLLDVSDDQLDALLALNVRAVVRDAPGGRAPDGRRGRRVDRR